MEKAANWSTAMCKCAKKQGAKARKCADKLKEPRLENNKNMFGGPRYSLESSKAHVEMLGPGMQCQMEISSDEDGEETDSEDEDVDD